MPFWHPAPDGVTLAVKVQPKSRRPGIRGRTRDGRGECLRIGVADPPEDGRANRAACALVADAIGIPPSAVRVVLGQTGRSKTLHVQGDPTDLTRKLEEL